MTIGPKPFSSLLRIGTDITNINRHRTVLQRLVRKPDSPRLVRKYLAKIFNRLEWPEVETRLGTLLTNERRDEWDPAKGPKISVSFAIWIAGRWAAKEAAIKAHAPRVMHMRQVSILRHETLDRICPGYSKGMASSKPAVLIDPPAPLILMSHETAQLRGLVSKGADVSPLVYVPSDSDIRQVDVNGSKSNAASARRVRRARVRMEDRQLADLSISHDGHYAVATVLAAMEGSQYGEAETIIDDGSEKERLHEPDYGDEGFHPSDDEKAGQLCN